MARSMTEGSTIVTDFLLSAGWQGVGLEPLAGDMSSRRYFRVSKDGSTAVLMVADAPMTAFVDITNWIAALGLSAPRILHENAAAGLLLLEDFGTQSVKSVLVDEAVDAEEIFEDCVTLLLKIRAADVPNVPSPEAKELVDWTRLADDHYPGIAPDGLRGFRITLRDILENALGESRTTSLRDFHTENMMWLPTRDGVNRLGLLDYQDAILTHPAYDLMSLLTDARTWVPKRLREDVIAHYLRRSGDDEVRFRQAFSALSAQRNLRILGVFARAGKYAEYVPNTYRYFVEALAHPAFDAVRDDVLSSLPEPEGF